MATEHDSVSIRGMRKAHLTQLACYIRDVGLSGTYWGNREQFRARHEDLMVFADRLEALATNPTVRIAPNYPPWESWENGPGRKVGENIVRATIAAIDKGFQDVIEKYNMLGDRPAEISPRNDPATPRRTKGRKKTQDAS